MREQIYTCDRCGESTTDYYQREEYADVSMEYGSGSGHAGGSWDLCGKCADQLVLWMKKKER